jgi:hypothetical protein
LQFSRFLSPYYSQDLDILFNKRILSINFFNYFFCLWVLTAAIRISWIIIKKFLYLICAPFSKIWKKFYNFFVYFLEISESNIIIIFSFGNFFVTIILSVSKYLLIKKIKEYSLRCRYADISLSGVSVISIYILVGIGRVKKLNMKFDFNIFI